MSSCRTQLSCRRRASVPGTCNTDSACPCRVLCRVHISCTSHHRCPFSFLRRRVRSTSHLHLIGFFLPGRFFPPFGLRIQQSRHWPHSRQDPACIPSRMPQSCKHAMEPSRPLGMTASPHGAGAVNMKAVSGQTIVPYNATQTDSALKPGTVDLFRPRRQTRRTDPNRSPAVCFWPRCPKNRAKKAGNNAQKIGALNSLEKVM